jgi:F-type H+-transporting ATPase subunit delta
MANVAAQRIARNYAEALAAAATPSGKEGEVLAELAALVREVFVKQPMIELFLSSGSINRGAKDEVIDKTFAGKSSETFVNFLHVLNHHGRLDLLPDILTALEQLRDQRLRRVRVFVRSATPLTEDFQRRLGEQVRTALHLEPVLESTVDPDLLGGMVVRVGDWVFDGSVRTTVQRLRNLLVESSHHEIQSGRDRFCT